MEESARAKAAAKQPAAGKRESKGSLSDQVCRAFADELAKTVSSGDRAAVSALIDWNSVIDTAFQGLAVPEAQRQELRDGIKSGLDKETGITGQLVKNGQAGGTFDYLRTRQNQGRQVVLMRMIQPAGAGGVIYFEFVPGRSAGGKTRAVDIYIYSSAEFVSASLHRVLLPVVASLSRTFLDKLLTSERDYVSDLPKLPGIDALILRGEKPGSLAKLKALRQGHARKKNLCC